MACELYAHKAAFLVNFSAVLCIVQVSFLKLCCENFYLPTHLLVRSH